MNSNRGKSLARGELDILVKHLQSTDPTEVEDALREIRGNLSKNRGGERYVKHKDIPTLLLKHLRREERSDIQYEASLCIADIISASSSSTNAMVDAGVLDTIQTCIETSDTRILENLVLAVCNVAGRGVEMRDKVMEVGLLANIIDIIKSPRNPINVLIGGVWTIGNIMRFKPPPRLDIVENIVPMLTELSRTHENETMLGVTGWGLCYITEYGGRYLQSVVDAGCVKDFLKHANNSSPDVSLPHIRGLSNLVSADDSNMALLLESGPLPVLGRCLESKSEDIICETLFVLSNILVGTPEQAITLTNIGILEQIVALASSANRRIGGCSVCAVSDAVRVKDMGMLRKLITAGALEALLGFLSGARVSPRGPGNEQWAEGMRRVGGVLDSIDVVFEQCSTETESLLAADVKKRVEEVNGVGTIKRFTTSSNHTVSSIANKILTLYLEKQSAEVTEEMDGKDGKDEHAPQTADE